MESKLLRRYPLGSFLFLPTIAHPTMQSRVGLSLSRAPEFVSRQQLNIFHDRLAQRHSVSKLGIRIDWRQQRVASVLPAARVGLVAIGGDFRIQKLNCYVAILRRRVVAHCTRPSAEIEMNVVRPEAVRKDPSLAFRPGRDLVVLKCDYQEIMLVAREFSSFARRDCNGKNADIVVFEQQTMMRLSRNIDWKLLLR